MLILKGIIIGFVLINLGIFFMCCHLQFNLATTVNVYKTIYNRFFYKTAIILKNMFKHPIITVRLLIKKLIYIVLRIFSSLIYPSNILGTYPVLVELIIFYNLLSLFGLHFLIKIVGSLICFVIFTIYFSKSDNIHDKLEPKVISIWTLSCSWYKTFDNMVLTDFEKLMGNPVTKKIDPKEFAKQKADGYIAFSEKIDKEHDDRQKRQNDTEKKPVHKTSYLDVLYPNELAILGFYMKDFTLDDLKLKKRELLKVHHSDNFREAVEIQAANQKCQQINEAYTMIYKELTKVKEA